MTRTASEWMKCVHVKESEECDLAEDGEELLDSAKKKKKKWKKYALAFITRYFMKYTKERYVTPFLGN